MFELPLSDVVSICLRPSSNESLHAVGGLFFCSFPGSAVLIRAAIIVPDQHHRMDCNRRFVADDCIR